MKKTLCYLGAALLFIAVFLGGSAYAQSSLWWPFPENSHQPDFIAETRIIARMVPQGGSHGGHYEPQYIRVVVLRDKVGSVCFIGNDTEPYNWSAAPLSLCRGDGR